jgi:hypothetical protein
LQKGKGLQQPLEVRLSLPLIWRNIDDCKASPLPDHRTQARAADGARIISRAAANSMAIDQRKELDAKKRDARGLKDALLTSEERLARLTAKKEKLAEEHTVLQERVNTVCISSGSL